jgi:hypothetical protein
MDVIILRDTYIKGEPVSPSNKAISVDDADGRALIRANKAILAESKPKKKAAKKD